MNPTVALRPLTGNPEEGAGLLRCLEDASGDFRRATGRWPGAADPPKAFSIVPKGETAADAFTWGVSFNDPRIGCADVLRGVPEVDSAALGLLFMVERSPGKGVASMADRLVEYAARGCKKVMAWILRLKELGVAFGKDRDFASPAKLLPTRATIGLVANGWS